MIESEEVLLDQASGMEIMYSLRRFKPYALVKIKNQLHKPFSSTSLLQGCSLLQGITT